jgi:hypothetical protein
MASRHSRELELEYVQHHAANMTSEEMPHNTTAAATIANLNEILPQSPKTDAEVVPSQKPNADEGEAVESRESSQPHPHPHADTEEPQAGWEVPPQGENAVENDGYYPMALDVCATGTPNARLCDVLTTPGRLRK